MRSGLSGKALVIQLTRDNIRIAAVQLGAKARLFGCTELDAPKGAVEDGIIRDIDALAKLIKNAVQQPAFEGIKRVVFALCTTQVISEQVSVPAARGEKLEKIMAANMDVYFPVEVSEYKVTRREVGRSRDENGRKNIIMQLWAIPAELLGRYYTLAAACGLSVAAIDYCGSSLATTAEAKKEENKTEVCLMAEPEMLAMTIIHAGRISMQRSFYCGNDLEIALSEAMLVLDYYRSFNEWSGESAEAVICGSLAENGSFCSRVSEVLDIPARVHKCGSGAEWSICVGAAQTELDFGGRRSRKNLLGTPWHYGVVLLGGAAAMLSLAVFMGSRTLWTSELSAMRDMEITLRLQSRQRSEAAQEYSDYEAEYMALLDDSESVSDELRSCNRDVWPALREINSKMPEGTRVNEVAVSADGIRVVFGCDNKEKAAALISELRKMKLTEVEDVFELADESYGGVQFGVKLLYSELFFNDTGKPAVLDGIELLEKLEVER